jgi:hypothetical protein
VTTTTFSVDLVRQLRLRAARASRVTREGPRGWSKSGADPMKVLAPFGSLRLKQGLVLRGYAFRLGWHSDGVAWAMPETAPFPQPDQSDVADFRFLRPLQPSAALVDVMEGVEGDGSAWSYLSASLFAREIDEFGATGYRATWGTHAILGDDPLRSGARPRDPTCLDRPSSDPAHWEWWEPRPSDWEPQVSMGPDAVIVRFYTYSGLIREAIYRHEDVYLPGRYQFTRHLRALAEGPAGFVF